VPVLQLPARPHAPAGRPLAVLSYDLWQRHFNGDSAIVVEFEARNVDLTVFGDGGTSDGATVIARVL
jgi:hypothetical protein